LKLGNKVAQEGVDRCACGCKYWENDRCIDCGTHVSQARADAVLADIDARLTPEAKAKLTTDDLYDDTTGLPQ
jgi:hypothetical protein